MLSNRSYIPYDGLAHKLAGETALAKICVVGSGVSGLSCGVRLAEAGHAVTIVARDPPERSTSAVAAALWFPYLAAPVEKVARWGAATFQEFLKLADDPETGVVLREGYEGFRDGAPAETAETPWAGAVLDFARLGPKDGLPRGWTRAFRCRVPVAETPVYLPYLERRFTAAGGRRETATLRTLDEALPGHDVVVNCAGLGARELASDPLVKAYRGQVVRVAQVGITKFWLDDFHPEGLTYIIPRRTDVILGGTADEGAEELVPDMAVARAIVARCAQLDPAVAAAPVLEHKIGLRPGRREVRLGLERSGDKRVVHNYGHGGAGITLSWGCAGEVVALVEGR